VMKPGFRMSGLPRFSESLCPRSSNGRSPLHYFALGGDCLQNVLGQNAPTATTSPRVSLPSLHAEFLTANSGKATQ
jgi:hypothetical protein